MNRKRVIPAIALLFCMLACGGKTVNTTVAMSAEQGMVLAKGIKAIGDAVIAAEAKGSMPRNEARAVIEKLAVISERGSQAAKLMQLIVQTQGTEKQAASVSALQSALDSIDKDLITLLRPVSDNALVSSLVELVAEVSRTINLINREVIGRIR